MYTVLIARDGYVNKVESCLSKVYRLAGLRDINQENTTGTNKKHLLGARPSHRHFTSTISVK